ncbi:hypothetical protein CXF85_08610 [Colwellia sp. 75C3]|uniref:hypothetical protein n=1 Tax=Colwellia sp. 75C3 TaxID=888425 RepID=UPI000C3330F6|nr:hypothetical protein [Colwellia sp. 75C3]PKG84375.1 hypothetical protein CXF85_08610 [Colwellia sp. 75C3]
MKPSDIEKEAIEKYTMGNVLITDLGEALNILSIHGEKCEKAIDISIRAEACKAYIASKNNNK